MQGANPCPNLSKLNVKEKYFDSRRSNRDYPIVVHRKVEKRKRRAEFCP